MTKNGFRCISKLQYCHSVPMCMLSTTSPTSAKCLMEGICQCHIRIGQDLIEAYMKIIFWRPKCWTRHHHTIWCAMNLSKFIMQSCLLSTHPLIISIFLSLSHICTLQSCPCGRQMGECVGWLQFFLSKLQSNCIELCQRV